MCGAARSWLGFIPDGTGCDLDNARFRFCAGNFLFGWRNLVRRGAATEVGLARRHQPYGSEYVTPAVNWNEFFLKLGGGSFRNVSKALMFRLVRLYNAMVMPAPALAE